MEIIHFSIDALNPSARQAMESVVGHPLRTDQRLVIQVLEAETASASGGTANTELPEWCDVFAGLTSEEVAAVDASIASRSPSRDIPTIGP